MESIKALRKRLGLSLATVAERAGMLDEAVARAERAGIDPRASTLLALARAMQVPVCDLFGKEGARGHARQRQRRQRRA